MRSSRNKVLAAFIDLKTLLRNVFNFFGLGFNYAQLLTEKLLSKIK